MFIPDEKRDIPGYAEAVKRENDIRDAALLNLNTQICGVEIRQMTLRDWIVLDGIASQMFSAETPAMYDIARFLWLLSPKFQKRNRFARWCFVRSCRKLPYGECVAKIRRFIEDTFQDSPPSSGNAKWSPPQFSFAASVVHSIASAYHWPREIILSLPLKEIFQYKKIIRICSQTTGAGAAAQRNPSDIIEIRYIRAERERRKVARQQSETESN